MDQSSDGEISLNDMEMYVELHLVIETQQITPQKISGDLTTESTEKAFLAPPSPSNHDRRRAYQQQKLARKYERAAIKGIKW